MRGRRFAVVEINNRKHTEKYSDPIMVGDSLDELQEKIGRKMGEPSSELGIDLGFDDFGDDGGEFF